MADPVTPPVAAVVPPAPAAAAPPAGGTPPVDPAGGTPSLAGEPAPAADPAKAGEPAKDPAKAPDAPAAFDPAKLTLPEGLKADDPFFKTFSETLADEKLSPQERGQKMLDLHKDIVKASADAQRTAWDQVNADWVKAVKADPEVGGAKFEATKTVIAKAIDSLGPDLSVAFRQGLDVTGAGNHPAIWKGLAKMAAILTEGGHVAGNPASKTEPNIGETFFPNSKMT